MENNRLFRLPGEEREDPPIIHALVLAAGRGTRTGLKENKMAYSIGGHALLYYSLRAVLASPRIEACSAVLSLDAEMNMQEALFDLSQEDNRMDQECLIGGDTRQQSVLSALEMLAIQPILPDYVLIHDGARPLLPREVLESLIDKLDPEKAAAPVLPAFDTLREVDDEGRLVKTLDRSKLVRMQTPQLFPFEKLLELHRKAADEGLEVTDDIELFLREGLTVETVPGSEENRKVTTAEDLEWVRGRLEEA